MKCVKCGYISFDYLSVCKKCGVSLNQARSGLGFIESKPEPPEYLKALIDEGGGTDGADAAGRAASPVEDTTLQLEQALTEEQGIRFGSKPASETQPATASVVETPDEWAVDSKWLGLEEPSQKPVVVDMPDVDDLVLELGDDEAPARAHGGGHPGEMGFDKDMHSFDMHTEESLDDLLFEDFSHGGDEEHSLPEADSDLDLFAKPLAKSEEPSMELDEDLDDLVLELGNDGLELAEVELEETSANS